ncbi:hypothetical protein [Sphingomonas sp. CCH21-G11]|uniref:hypothetical protein n=1 Tax=Sphingomonas sp. CCH21-G11 TaxID=1768749 RepID=UPI000837711D|nr:hypothetical protein [Sphingomonas sp. CCH21-G11]
MFNSQLPDISELPTSNQLLKSTLLAVVAASAILVTIVLPSEYGIDPTGIGRALNLTEMGEIKMQLAAEAKADAAKDASGTATAAPASAAAVPSTTPATSAPLAGATEVRLTLQPGQGEEVKATMKTGQEFAYRWSTDSGKVNFELHGEPIGAGSSDYTSYEKGSSTGASGTFRAPFDGTHGWFWRNRGTGPVTITVSAKGGFEKFALVQ